MGTILTGNQRALGSSQTSGKTIGRQVGEILSEKQIAREASGNLMIEAQTGAEVQTGTPVPIPGTIQIMPIEAEAEAPPKRIYHGVPQPESA